MEEAASLDLDLSATIPDLIVTPTVAQIFSFSAVTWNRHQIHYNKDAALAEGHKDVVVQRALLGNFLAALLDQWLGDRGTVKNLSWKVLNSALPGRPLHCRGTASIEGQTAFCDLAIVNELGDEVATGKAECLLQASACR